MPTRRQRGLDLINNLSWHTQHTNLRSVCFQDELASPGPSVYSAHVPTQEERRTHTKAAIIEAAYRAYEKQGSPDVALETIAEMAGVTKGSIHYHFSNRAGLIAAVAIWLFRKIEERISSAPPKGCADCPAVYYVRTLLGEQAKPAGRVLFTIGDELARAGRLDEIDPYRYLCTRLKQLGVHGSVNIVAGATVQLGRQLAYGMAKPSEIDQMIASLCEGGRLGPVNTN